MAKSFKRRIRMLQAVRLERALYKDPEIAAFLNMTPAGLAVMKADPEYVNLRMEQLTGVVSEIEEEMLKNQEYKHQQLRSLIPTALQNLYDLARSQNEHVKLKATAEILDRDGSMAKVSRIGLATAEQGGVGNTIDDEVAQSLLRIQKIQEERAKAEAEAGEKSPEKGNTTIQ